ncbi:hypothetical protein J2X71_006452 [Rhizobium sp. 1399]|nr:hypothetical protein [Rhizobium sp. 1399]
MSNNNDAHRVYTDAITAQLGGRVTNLGRRQTDLESEVRSGFKNIDTAVTSLANETRASIAALSSNLAERNKPQWQALGVALTFAAMLGGLAYLPIREATSDLKQSVGTFADKMVTRQELEWRTERGAEDRARTVRPVTINASLISNARSMRSRRSRGLSMALGISCPSHRTVSPSTAVSEEQTSRAAAVIDHQTSRVSRFPVPTIRWRSSRVLFVLASYCPQMCPRSSLIMASPFDWVSTVAKMWPRSSRSCSRRIVFSLDAAP